MNTSLQAVEPPKTAPGSLSAPLVVSVTGHRDLIEEGVLIQSFNDELEKLERKFNVHEKQNRLLLSALASGADTLAANVALKRGWQVIAPLPLEVDDYRHDFQGDELDKFNELLTKCPHFFIGYAPGCTPENTREQGHFRDLQYAFVGEFLTRHCEVLIAFWDGWNIGEVGGTGDVVALQERGIRGGLLELRRDGALLDAPEGGRTIVISSWRNKHTKLDYKDPKSGERIRDIKDGKNHGVATSYPDPIPDPDPKEIQRRKKLEAAETERREKLREAWQQFVAQANQIQEKDVDDDLRQTLAGESPYLSQVRDACLRADVLAGQLQREVNRQSNWILGASAAFTVFVSVAEASEWSGTFGTGALVLSWACLALALGVVQQEKRGKRGKRATRQQDYRALAEAWRIAFFWRAVGIGDSLDESYLRSQRGELDWIRHALRASDLKWRGEHGFPSATSDGFEQARAEWVDGQLKYFKGKYPQDREYLTALRNWSWALVAFGLVASAVLAWAQVSADGSSNAAGARLWGFVTTFASANALTSPLVPGVLSLIHMLAWPVVTGQNSQSQSSATPAEKRRLRKMRRWFIRESAKWTLASVAGALAILALVAAFYVGHSLSAPQTSVLQVMATICFFLPALIFVHAEFKALPEHVRLYERMYRVFEGAKTLLDEVAASPHATLDETQAKARRIYLELGREALHENGEWLLIHRERPLDIEA